MFILEFSLERRNVHIGVSSEGPNVHSGCHVDGRAYRRKGRILDAQNVYAGEVVRFPVWVCLVFEVVGAGLGLALFFL